MANRAVSSSSFINVTANFVLLNHKAVYRAFGVIQFCKGIDINYSGHIYGNLRIASQNCR